jgi:hypothetical protein
MTTNTNPYVEALLSQKKVNTDRFPIGEVIKEVLEKQKISYTEVPARGGFDVRVAKKYDIMLPAKRIGGLFGILKKTAPITTLKDLCAEVNEKYFSQFEPLVLKNRPDLAEPSILMDKFAEYIVTSQKNNRTKDGFLDVADIRVKGYIIN